MTSHAMNQLKKLTQLIMERLNDNKLLSLTVPRSGQYDLAGVIEYDEDSYNDQPLMKRSLLNDETARRYGQLIAIAGLVSQNLYYDRTISLRKIIHNYHTIFQVYTNIFTKQVIYILL